MKTETILETRKALIDAQLEPYWRLIEKLKGTNVGPESCLAAVIGKLVLAFERSGLGAITALKASASSYRGTVDDLKVILRSSLSSEALRHCQSCPSWIAPGCPLPVHVEGGIINENRQDWLNARAEEAGLARTERDFWSGWEAAA